MSEKPFGAPADAYPLSRTGIDAPTTARIGTYRPMGALTLFFRWRKKSVQKKASGTATPEAAHVAMRRGLRSAVAPSGLSSSTGCPVSHSSLPVALLASHPPCGSLWAAPKAPLGPRFPSGQFAALTRREKALDCPFCRRGSLCRAHPNWQNFTCYRARSELAFFRRQNGRTFFPPLPIAALLPRSWHWADSKKCKLGCFGRDWVASQRQKASFFFSL